MSKNIWILWNNQIYVAESYFSFREKNEVQFGEVTPWGWIDKDGQLIGLMYWLEKSAARAISRRV